MRLPDPGEALRANAGVIRYEFVRNLPEDMEIKVLPGGGSVLLNMPSEPAAKQ